MNRSLNYALMVGLLIALAASEAPAQQATRAGVDAAKTRMLTLREAITTALENNRDIEIERINVQMNEFDLRASEGVYDPKLSAGFYFDHRTTPVASLLAGGENGRLKTTDFSGTAKITQRLPWQGGSVSAGFERNRATTENLFYSLNPQFTTSLSVEFTQPLWRNRVIDAERRQIKIAKKKLDLSDSQFRQRAIEIIACDKFCRRCGARQRAETEALETPASLAPTTGLDELSPYATAPLQTEDLYHPISGPLVKSVTASLTAKKTARLKGRWSKGLILSLISIPIWLMIVLLSPFDAYIAARTTVEQQ